MMPETTFRFLNIYIILDTLYHRCVRPSVCTQFLAQIVTWDIINLIIIIHYCLINSYQSDKRIQYARRQFSLRSSVHLSYYLLPQYQYNISRNLKFVVIYFVDFRCQYVCIVRNLIRLWYGLLYYNFIILKLHIKFQILYLTYNDKIH